MAITTPSTALVALMPLFTGAERLALAGFLAGYGGLTWQAYELDLRQFASWCQQHQLQLFRARRADIELFTSVVVAAHKPMICSVPRGTACR
jgi:integrase/recombinase XerD